MKKIIVLVTLFISSFLWTACEVCECPDDIFTLLKIESIDVIVGSNNSYYDSNNTLVDLKSSFYLNATFNGVPSYSSLLDNKCWQRNFGFTALNACSCAVNYQPEDKLSTLEIFAWKPDTETLENVTSEFELYGAPEGIDNGEYYYSGWHQNTYFNFRLKNNSTLPNNTHFVLLATFNSGDVLESKSREVHFQN